MMLLAQAEAAAGDTAEIVLFWVFAVLALGAGIAVITMRNIVHGALMLVLNFLAIAGLFLTLESAFLSIIQVLVYGGAIMVLFLFVIMLLGVDNDDLLRTEGRNRVFAVAGGGLLAVTLMFAFVGPYTSDASVCNQEGVVATSDAVPCRGFEQAYDEDDGAGVAFLGRSMFTRYTFPFELSALLLTVATIGAVILARRRDLAAEDEDEIDLDVTSDDSRGRDEVGTHVPAGDVSSEIAGSGSDPDDPAAPGGPEPDHLGGQAPDDLPERED
jgi:NADH-quinone oxidoreductase subunit J